MSHTVLPLTASSCECLTVADVDDPRATDNAWIETTAVHVHCPFELGKRLSCIEDKEQRKLKDGIANVVWADIDVVRASTM